MDVFPLDVNDHSDATPASSRVQSLSTSRAVPCPPDRLHGSCLAHPGLPHVPAPRRIVRDAAVLRAGLGGAAQALRCRPRPGGTAAQARRECHARTPALRHVAVHTPAGVASLAALRRDDPLRLRPHVVHSHAPAALLRGRQALRGLAPRGRYRSAAVRSGAGMCACECDHSTPKHGVAAAATPANSKVMNKCDTRQQKLFVRQLFCDFFLSKPDEKGTLPPACHTQPGTPRPFIDR